MATPILEVSDLAVSFVGPRGWNTVIQDVNFSVEPGQILGIVGESGSGKTVSCLTAMGLLNPSISRVASESSIKLEGEDVLKMSRRDLNKIRGNKMAMIFQEPMTSLNPAFTVGDQISEGLRIHKGLSKRDALKRAVELLDLVGIPHPSHVVHAYPHSFSGGMRQRVMIALAVACDPALLIADEPTTALDVTVQAQILDLLRQMRDEIGLSVLFITHDLGVIADVCDDVVVMYAGQVVETSPVQELFEHPKHPYSEGLLAAMPRLGSDTGGLGVIPGRVPPPWEFPKGCRFESRCPYSNKRCLEPTTLTSQGPDHVSACHLTNELSLEGV